MFFLLKLEWNLIFGIKTKTHIHQEVLLTDSTLEKQGLSLMSLKTYFPIPSSVSVLIEEDYCGDYKK